MPRFYFDLHDGVKTIDNEGVECRDVEHAQILAKRMLPEIALDEVPRDGDAKSYSVSVRNQQDEVVYTASLDFRGRSP